MNKFITTVIMAAGLVSASVATAAPASADDRPWTQLITNDAGKWKAYGIHEYWNDQICVRAYNSVAGAKAKIELQVIGGNTYVKYDEGGDEARSCLPIPDLGGRGVALKIFHLPVSGSVVGSLGVCYAVPQD
ncbi:hypothetical protein SAMN05192558_107102 [Actinokineospora alba]|uniref:Secreted protein n=1 Tax=Actinokineospora alba TaxID=504798 RepID=A0A1H0QQF3_9PSEU|nr:hypothetical protein [Actinokineospora alba]TDP70439.1 hypothetical protein C8E96_6049 [Actinokineospora alba]SDI31584.1 hypothetical protein SAMN05421871_104101 [Actinokineospora alba]SDP19591.1 hypothetical protein SAMN05192558_107102 [Actinokineospora alba]